MANDAIDATADRGSPPNMGSAGTRQIERLPSLRDEIAMRCISGMLVCGVAFSSEEIADRAYRIADAMVERRKRSAS